MIVVLTVMTYAAELDAEMRELVPEVEHFCRSCDGCERFDLSFTVGRPAVLLAAEVWRDRQALQAHAAAAHKAPELDAWHKLLNDSEFSLFEASPIPLDAITGEGTR